MSNYLDTLEMLQEERNNVVDMLYLRKSDQEVKIDSITRIGAKKIWQMCQQYFAFSDQELRDHLKLIDDEVDELLMLVSLDEMGIGKYLKSLE